MKIGDIKVSYTGFFRRPLFEVVWEMSKNSASSALFRNFERARIFSQILKSK